MPWLWDVSSPAAPQDPDSWWGWGQEMRTEVESSITGYRVVTKCPRPHSGLVWFCCSWRLHWYDVGDVSSFPEGEMEEHFTLTPFIIKDPSERGPVLLSTLPVVYIPVSFPCRALSHLATRWLLFLVLTHGHHPWIRRTIRVIFLTPQWLWELDILVASSIFFLGTIIQGPFLPHWSAPTRLRPSEISRNKWHPFPMFIYNSKLWGIHGRLSQERPHHAQFTSCGNPKQACRFRISARIRQGHKIPGSLTPHTPGSVGDSLRTSVLPLALWEGYLSTLPLPLTTECTQGYRLHPDLTPHLLPSPFPPFTLCVDQGRWREAVAVILGESS